MKKIENPVEILERVTNKSLETKYTEEKDGTKRLLIDPHNLSKTTILILETCPLLEWWYVGLDEKQEFMVWSNE